MTTVNLIYIQSSLNLTHAPVQMKMYKIFVLEKYMIFLSNADLYCFYESNIFLFIIIQESSFSVLIVLHFTPWGNDVSLSIDFVSWFVSDNALIEGVRFICEPSVCRAGLFSIIRHRCGETVFFMHESTVSLSV